MTRISVLALVAAVLVAAQTASAGQPASCGSRTAGATGITTEASGGGPPCLLAAYQRCSPAVYRLSIFGVDTIDRSTFTVSRSGGRCTVAVVGSFQVVPQKPRPPEGGHCLAIVRRGGDIDAIGCSGAGLAPTVSLSGRR